MKKKILLFVIFIAAGFEPLFAGFWGASGLRQSSFMLNYGTQKNIYGYYDDRIIGPDRENYINDSRYHYANLDLKYVDLSSYYSSLQDFVLGINISGAYKDGLKKELHAVPAEFIPEQTFPEKKMTQAAKQDYYFNFFMGIDKKWWELEGGIGIQFLLYKDWDREQMTASYESGVNEETKTIKGHGFVPDSASVSGNFLFRLGPEQRAHIKVSYNRENFNPVHGKLQMKFVFPVIDLLSFAAGTYLYPSTAIFLEPEIKFFGFSVFCRAGLVLDYREDYLDRVGIEDSVIANLGLKYSWN